jgi:DNA modification methylase
VSERARSQRTGAAPPAAHGEASAQVLAGDALTVLASLPEGHAQTCITSPPYWGLRDYGVAPRAWGGDPACPHRWGAAERGRRSDLLPCEETRSRARLSRDGRQGGAGMKGGRFCQRCGAWLGCLGLEPDPDLYVSHLVAVLREVRRVLREDGTLWLVLGDSFAANRSYQVRDRKRGEPGGPLPARVPATLKPKDLVGIPWRVAFALQADGWWLRSDIVWAKPNAMPESVTDRPTRAHEFVFLLTPSRRYFYDAEAVREPDQRRRSGNGYKRPERLSYGGGEAARGQEFEWVGGAGRNRRSVWTVATQCFKGAHFATFPEALVEPCLLAGTSPAACRVCGAPLAAAGRLAAAARRRARAERQLDRRGQARLGQGFAGHRIRALARRGSAAHGGLGGDLRARRARRALHRPRPLCRCSHGGHRRRAAQP